MTAFLAFIFGLAIGGCIVLAFAILTVWLLRPGYREDRRPMVEAPLEKHRSRIAWDDVARSN